MLVYHAKSPISVTDSQSKTTSQVHGPLSCQRNCKFRTSPFSVANDDNSFFKLEALVTDLKKSFEISTEKAVSESRLTTEKAISESRLTIEKAVTESRLTTEKAVSESNLFTQKAISNSILSLEVKFLNLRYAFLVLAVLVVAGSASDSLIGKFVLSIVPTYQPNR